MSKQTESTEQKTTKKFVTKQTELADIIGVSRRTISRWIKEIGGVGACVSMGMAKPNGRYVVAAWKAYAELRAEEGDDGSDPTQSAAKAEQLLIQNERLKLKLGRERGELIPKALAQQVYGKFILNLKGRLYSSVIRFVTLSRMAPNTPAAIESVKSELTEILKAVAEGKKFPGDATEIKPAPTEQPAPQVQP